MLIGAFDSGLGGLLLIKSLSQHFPQEKFIYLVDTKNFPYGEKSVSAIRAIVDQNIQFLIQKKVDFIIITCNTACSVLEKKNYAVPLAGVIEFALEQAHAFSKNKRVGLLATEVTVESNAYLQTSKQLGLSLNIYQQSCPLLAPIVQQGDADKEDIVIPVIKKYLAPFIEKEVDTVIIGCTHYLYLERWIQQLMGKYVKLVEPSDFLIQYLAQIKKSTFKKDKDSSSFENSGQDSKVSIHINMDRPQYRERCLTIMKGINVQFFL